MKFDIFLNIYKNVPVIDSSTFSIYSNKTSVLRRQVRSWVKKGYLISLKRGLYIFSENYRQIEPSNLFLANYIISPSYVSLEYALGYYDLIPERVTVFTSITSKKTNSFTNPLGKFEYRKIKEKLFFGFRKEKERREEFFIAHPEKAILDYFYLNHNFKGAFDEFDSMRLQNLDIFDVKKLDDYKSKYNKRVTKVIRFLIEYIDKYTIKYRKL